MTKTIVNNDIVLFDELTHSYFVNGEKCISVTQLLKFWKPDKYKDIDPEILEKASRRGSYYHLAIEIYEKTGLEDDFKEFRNYKLLKKAYNFTVLDNEVLLLLKYKGLTVCGRTDLVIKKDDKLMLADLKFTSELDREYVAMQLAFYKLAYEQTYNRKIDSLAAIHLKNDTRRFIEFNNLNYDCAYEILDNYIGGKYER